jgi:CRISPR system Cascade subunit CasB
MTEFAQQSSRASLLRDEVGKRVTRLQAALLDLKSPANAEAMATLARLRRCSPAEPGADPRVWEITFSSLPEKLRGQDFLSYSEQVIHACLVLYAIHQQSKDTPVHKAGARLGSAVQELAKARGRDGKPDESTIRRLHQVALATDASARLHHLRGLIALMRSERQPIQLDYSLLAVDLRQLIDPSKSSDHVIARWGRDLHNRPRTQTTGVPK